MLTATATTTAATMRRGKKQRTGEAADEQASGPEQDLFGSPTEEEDAFTQARTQMEEELQRATGGSRFDPHPDEAKVRELRSGYARLFSEARSNKSDLVLPASDRLVDMLDSANELLASVHTTADAALDSRFVALSADLGAEKISKLAVGTLDFGVGEFCTLVKAALTKAVRPAAGDERHDWSTLGCFATRHWRGVATLDVLLGPIAVEAQERRPRVRAAAERDVAPVVQPAVLAAVPAGGVPETTANVIAVFEALAAVSPVPFYKFVVHPTLFSRTVENLFYVSFLANDNRVRIDRDPDSAELILAVIDDDDSDSESARPKHQAIFRMTMPLWRDMVLKYNIQRPMVPF